jgi:hypothetical protein
MEYTPAPIDTSSIAIPGSLNELIEKLAMNTHAIWAQERIRQGWTWGERRDDSRKKHPGLIPYDRLSEEEKQFDRNTALEIIKATIALGYKIEKKQGGVQ